MNDLKENGYNNYYKILDAQDFGIPQRRKRVFIVSIRKDIDKGSFSFPKEKTLKKDMGDYLIDYPDEKYYKVNKKIIDKIKNKNNIRLGNGGKVVCNTITRAIPRQGSSKEFILNCSLIYMLTGEIRRITPLECFKLMGFEEIDYFKVKKSLENTFYNGADRSDTRLYTMAANSIVVPVVESIFENLF